MRGWVKGRLLVGVCLGEEEGLATGVRAQKGQRGQLAAAVADAE